MLVLVVSTVWGSGAGAISQADVTSVNSAIQSAFVSTYQAERVGGNVSSLVASLNAAVQLVENAKAENSTSPRQAAADLLTAHRLAQNVTAESASAATAGGALRQFVLARSLVSAGAILAVAALLYFHGGRIFRRLWVKFYGGYVVRRGPAAG